MSVISEEKSYEVTSALRFPIEENLRCHTVLGLLRGAESGDIDEVCY